MPGSGACVSSWKGLCWLGSKIHVDGVAVAAAVAAAEPVGVLVDALHGAQSAAAFAALHGALADAGLTS